MFALSSACVAISLADEAGKLRIEQRTNARLVAMGMNGDFVAISDDHGIIEVADDMDAANARVQALRSRRGA